MVAERERGRLQQICRQLDKERGLEKVKNFAPGEARTHNLRISLCL